MSIFNIPSDHIKFVVDYKFSTQYLNFVKKSSLMINQDIIHDMVASAISDGWEMARNNANKFRDTGFLMDHIFVYMTTKTQGWLASEADYSAAQEYGYRNRAGHFIKGRNFMKPTAAAIKKRLFENMKLLEKSFIAGVKATIPSPKTTIKSGFPSSARKPSRTGFQRQTTARKRTRSYYYSSVSAVSFKKVQRFGTFPRGYGRQFIGGRT